MPDKSIFFKEFKKIYPKKKDWVNAKNVWDKIQGDKYWALIKADIERMKSSENFKKEYIPYPTRYLNEHRWECSIVETKNIPIRVKRISIDSLELPRKVTNVLKMYGITTVGALKKASPKKILSLPGIGVKSLADIRDRI